MSPPYYADEAVTLHLGDCLDVLPTLATASGVPVTAPTALAPFPNPAGHVVSVDPTPDGDGFRAWCLPHGDLAIEPLYLDAFIAACVHDQEMGGDTT